MKKSLIALAVLGSLAAAAQAQSSVTLYGRVDLGLKRDIGDDTTRLEQGSGSRLGVRGVEDLGGGLKALFNIEHRFTADDGAANSTFWAGRSVVGLEGGFGQVVLGREYTPARNIANRADPFGGDTVGKMEPILFGDILPTRQNNSITYTSPDFGGLRGQVQITVDEVAGNDNKAFYGLNLTYGAGPLSLAYGFDKSGVDDDTWHLVTAGYDFGAFRLIGAYGQGKPEGLGAADKHRSYLLGATAPLGAGELKLAYGKLETVDPDSDVSTKFAVGYHYALSKRTTVYADVAHDREATNHKTGVDFGLKHNF
ncbi:porin [Caldimonas taiwanensis]|uniref:porin n=1 Tax=Caldimonas taiwanensis TaxID=307483 RepID=UPI0007819E36|nr:porin [Caldimonas taiwanensis]